MLKNIVMDIMITIVNSSLFGDLVFVALYVYT